MSKKNFKDNNPALQFISQSKEMIVPVETKNNTENTYTTDNMYYTDNTNNTHNTDNTPNTHNTDNTYNTNDTDKHNTDNMYNTHIADNTTYLKKPARKETKSKRLNLLIQPSLYQTLTKIAYIKQLSINELILRTMKEYATQNAKTVQKYDDFINNKE